MKILWIEDDYYAIKGLFRRLEKDGTIVENAPTAVEAFHKASNWQNYDLIVVDLILPLSNDSEEIPEIVKSWDKEAQVGIGIVKWLILKAKVTCPVLILSVIKDPIDTYELGHLNLAGCLPKIGLRPTVLKEEIDKILASKKK